MQTTPEERLRAQGLRVTRPRLTVLAVLDEAVAARDHLAVAEVEQRARAALGNLSRQAVYDCLEALTGAGLARRIEPAGHPARYEARTREDHHHMVCRVCGRTSDVDCTTDPSSCLSSPPTDDFVVDEAEVIFRGRCASCAAGANDTQPTAVRPNHREEPR